MTEQQNSLLKELTRRRVVQVALLYFAIAWTVTEVLSFLFSAIPVFPAWSKTLVAILFVLGFPVAMFLAWRFDIGVGGDFGRIKNHFESVITDGDGPIDYSTLRIDSIVQSSVAYPMIRVLEAEGSDEEAEALKAAVRDFMNHQFAVTPKWKRTNATNVARSHLWQGEIDTALDELETLPGVYMRDWWYLNREPDFEILHGHARFEAVIGALQSQSDADRSRLESPGGDLPACVTNMRARLQ